MGLEWIHLIDIRLFAEAARWIEMGHHLQGSEAWAWATNLFFPEEPITVDVEINDRTIQTFKSFVCSRVPFVYYSLSHNFALLHFFARLQKSEGMEASLARTWKRKQRKLNRKNSKKAMKKFKPRRDIRGKYFLLLSKSKYVALLKFTSQKMCEALCVVRMSKKLVKLMSKKYVLSVRRNKKFLRQVRVIVSEKLQDDLKSKFRDEAPQPPMEKEVGSSKAYQCPQCGSSFSGRGKLTRHMVVHSKLRSYKCTYCSKDYKRSDTLRRHQQSVHAVNLITDVKRFICQECKATFTSLGHLRVHIESKHDVNHQQKQQQSPRNFKSQETSYILVDGKMRLVCMMCNKSFSRKQHLRRHMNNLHAGAVDQWGKVVLIVY